MRLLQSARPGKSLLKRPSYPEPVSYSHGHPAPFLAHGGERRELPPGMIGTGKRAASRSPLCSKGVKYAHALSYVASVGAVTDAVCCAQFVKGGIYLAVRTPYYVRLRRSEGFLYGDALLEPGAHDRRIDLMISRRRRQGRIVFPVYTGRYAAQARRLECCLHIQSHLPSASVCPRDYSPCLAHCLYRRVDVSLMVGSGLRPPFDRSLERPLYRPVMPPAGQIDRLIYAVLNAHVLDRRVCLPVMVGASLRRHLRSAAAVISGMRERLLERPPSGKCRADGCPVNAPCPAHG